MAAGTELAAITMFIVIILKTARQSVEPHQIYEKFIFGAFFWFFAQAIVSDLLFFAKVTAVGVNQVVMRIALIDGPLRDIQLLGFGALIPKIQHFLRDENIARKILGYLPGEYKTVIEIGAGTGYYPNTFCRIREPGHVFL